MRQLSLMIWEWNTYQEFAEFYESAGADESSDPDAPEVGNTIEKRGKEGEGCEYENRRIVNEPSATQYCNDFLDFEDFTKYTPAPARRDFPQVDYL